MIIHDRQIKAFFRNIAVNGLVLLCVFGGEYIYQYHVKKKLVEVKEQITKAPTLKSENNPKVIKVGLTK